jgi:dihydrofolate synthase/folylpolyglutamate synthase
MMTLHNYEETLAYLYAQLPMFSRVGTVAYKKDLHNTIQLCNYWQTPQNKFKSIHIAGTNGKGSTSHMLAAVLQQAGYKVGLYTSPHLVDFRERIKINGKYISKTFVIDFTKKSLPLIQKVSPSFFELTVAMAFTYFAQENVDIAIIETGLGGRLDSTNVIQPLLSIITNIGWDHQVLLGDTLEKIAYEKAGIIKPHTPIVLSELQPEIFHVFETMAMKCAAPLTIAAKHVAVDELVHDGIKLSFRAVYSNKSISIQSSLVGGYQIHNIKAVLTAVDILCSKGYKITNEQVVAALANTPALTGLHGRWELLQTQPIVIADVAHNVDGMKQLLQNLNKLKATRTNAAIHIIIGMVKDKDVSAVFKLLPSNASYYFTQAQIPRAMQVDELQQLATNFERKGTTYNNVNTALDAALAAASSEDIILICGSVFVVGELENYRKEIL